MNNLQHRLYRLILALHPVDFRDQFGREMELDFKDALESHGFAPLCFDALLSLGRQWATSVSPETVEQLPIAQRSLLAGQYVMVSQGCLTLFDLARASLLCAMLFLAIGYAATVPGDRTMSNLQSRNASQHGGAYGAEGHHATGSEQSAHHDRWAVAAMSVAPSRGPQADYSGGELRKEKSEALKLSMTKHLSSTGSALVNRLLQWTGLICMAWLATLLLHRSPSIGRRVVLIALGLLAIAAPSAFGTVRMIPMHEQILHASGPLPSFEVATIRPWKPPAAPSPPPSLDGAPAPRKIAMVDPGPPGGQATDRVRMILPIKLLIGSAYNLPFGSERRILGAPTWLESDQYEIRATIENSLYTAMQKMSPAQQREQVNLMEQSLLADRFKLKVHFETREMPIYALVIAKGGPKLTPAKDGERSMLSALPGSDQGSEMNATAVTIARFAQSPIWGRGGRLVVDQTGLTGTYDFTLKWRADRPADLNADSDAPSVFTAIQEQLGLRLVPSKAQVEVIVIDHIEKPSEN